MSLLKEKREERARVYSQATELMKQPQTAEIRGRVEKLLNDVESLSQHITQIERADKLGNFSATTDVASPETVASAATYRSAYKDYLQRGPRAWANHQSRSGKRVMGEDSETLLEETRQRLEKASPEQRDQQAGQQSIAYSEGTTGGYFVPAGFVYDVDKATKYYCDLLSEGTVRVLETATGNILPYPTSNDTDQAWHILGEAQQIQQNNSGSGTRAANYPSVGTPPTTDAGDLLVGHVNFSAWKGSTGLIRVSLELAQDSAFNMEAFLTDAFAVRLGRGYEAYLTNGTGSNQPFGIVPAVTNSNPAYVTAAGSYNNDKDADNTGANSIGYQDLVALIHSVDPSYRKGAKFMLHDQTLAHLKTRLDGFGRPLWVPSAREGEPDRIAGYPYVINQSLPQIAASAKTVFFGAWQKFIVRKVKDLQVMRLDERFADFGQVAYVGFSRVDSNLIDAGTKPISYFQQHS